MLVRQLWRGLPADYVQYDEGDMPLRRSNVADRRVSAEAAHTQLLIDIFKSHQVSATILRTKNYGAYLMALIVISNRTLDLIIEIGIIESVIEKNSLSDMFYGPE